MNSVAVLLYGRVALFEFGVLHEVFGLDRTDDGVPAFDFRVASPTPHAALRVDGGVTIAAPYTLDDCLDVDLVAIPGAVRPASIRRRSSTPCARWSSAAARC